MTELEEFYELAEVLKVDYDEPGSQIGRFRELALKLIDEGSVFKQQMDMMTQGKEVADGLRKQLLEQSDNHIDQFEKATMAWMNVRERTLAINEKITE